MSNLMHAAMLARGMGGLQGFGYQAQGLGNWFDEWGDKIISQGFDFGKTFIQSKYAKDASKYQSPGYVNYSTQQQLAPTGTPPAANNDEYGSGGISGAGVRIGGTLVTWPTIALGVGVLVLIQSKPFTRGGGGRRSYY